VGDCLAIDIGGTKMIVGRVSREGLLRAVARGETPAGADAETLFGAVTGLVSEVGSADLDVCGVGCGGPMTRGGAEVSPLNIPGWRGFPLRDRLAELVGVPTFVDNDAKALALGEGWVGGAAGRSNFVAMVVSTGVGGGIVLDGRLLDGEDGNAGHIGHVIVEPDGRTCACGAQGCLEAEASGTAIAAATGRSAREAPEAVRRRTGTLVGRGVASIANLLDLDLALVAGSVALGFGDTFFSAAQAELDRLCRLDFSRGTEIRPAGLGEDGPVIGAAAVGWSGLGVDVLSP
jgi:glucokinase